jgi:hypothetical protein
MAILRTIAVAAVAAVAALAASCGERGAAPPSAPSAAATRPAVGLAAGAGGSGDAAGGSGDAGGGGGAGGAGGGSGDAGGAGGVGGAGGAGGAGRVADAGDAGDAGGSSGAAPAAGPPAADYRVRLSGPSRVAIVPRDGACAPPQASCRAEACFIPAPYVDRPASTRKMVACERDRDCAVVHNTCCGTGAIDIRAIRADQASAVPAHACGRAGACGAPDPALIASFTVGCVEKVCRLLQPLPATWCEDRDIRYRVARRSGAIEARDRTFDCHAGAPSCRIDADCYREVEPRAPRPAPELRRCTRDAECALAPVECCECGARDFRAIRSDAFGAWQSQRCSAVQACPACVGSAPSNLAPACLQGSCEVVEIQPPAACIRP